MGIKLKKIDRVPTSLKELIDVDSSTGIPRCVDCIANGMVLVASVSTIYKKDTFVFKHLTDIIKVGQGMQATLVNGILTISSSLESLNLNDLLDVSITNPADDDVLTYNSVLQRWENTSGGWVPSTRLITINGVTQDLSADRTWTISGGGSGTVTSVTGTGTVSGLTLSGSVTTSGSLTLGGTLVLTSGNITSGLGYTPYNATNPSNYITAAALSPYLTIASASSTYLTQVLAQSTYQPIFTTQNGLTYGGGNLELGGSLIKNTTIAGNGTGGPYYLYLQRFTELKLNADDGSDTTEIKLLPTQMQVKTPLYGSKSVGDVLTLKDPATGEVEFETPATASGGGIPLGTTSGTDTYTTTISGVTGYADGDAYIIRFTTGNTDAATLNINGLGAKTLFRNNDGAVIGGDIWDGAEMLCVFNSTNNGFDCIGTATNSLFAYVTNVNGSTISRGQVVYAFGGTGNRMEVKLARADADSTSAQTIGFVYSTSIANNQKGIIIIQGYFTNLSLFPPSSSWADGDTVYLSPSTAGAVTRTKPVAPQHLVYLGVVATASNGSSGRMYVRVQNGYEMNELHDVQSNGAVNNDILYRDTTVTPNLWKPASIPTILGYTPANIASPAFTGTPTAPTAVSGTNTTQIATTEFVQTAVQQSSSLVGVFGDGGSGNATITGALSLTTDAYYNDLTISGGGSIFLNGFRLFVRGTLDISNAGDNAIYNNGFLGDGSTSVTAGQNTGGGTLGRGGYGQTTSGWFSGASGSNVNYRGGNGGGGAAANTNNAGNGVQSPISTQAVSGGSGGTGGKGGNSTIGSGGTGGAGQTTNVSPAVVYTRTFVPDLGRVQTFRQSLAATTVTTIAAAGAFHGGGGGGGGSSTTSPGGGGSAGGGGGGNTIVYARQIVVGAGTNASAIAARGGDGGSSTYNPTANIGGGGGGAGGGGGYIYLVYGTITGGSYTFASANGGTGGNGGNGNGTGVGGQGGQGGSGGRITAISLSNNTITVVDGTGNLSATPTIPTTTTGSTGSAGGTCTFSS